ncbi:TPA: hypothetical protein DCX66_02755 [Candidatus Nomurabacteria bacterium]|uniref:Pesticidal crystal protein Cry22Aa Ig-like domain-containing protein n=1 Tax=Candidatus Nomurabacteria bacterium GW2011_GWE1_35_16 TaxID=1618761 RepID=A0A0G0EFK7_9BACT|nr:MAG: hypothetical protein UR55_C0013G0019 [Candidatus Nomurabacteria bacterium GW2011_GWF1_34_20]KKP62750.1 MAG: hypothetical protein UR57_C0012G0019 [Candidatus Nomurabacteria bacterium GW2011_GWE2_34_25]KKP66122.1 MAG: hypothetical protein UR64_C0012G0019 [Candidatus Nomurabacteria bacterium GW2011_GWE1_35_16]HAE36338.1 hypothetical protein [Candidatus Nomurabacteria bacterium]HAX65368.1 hypothetical protein [Candidatus Nomurabacteria bacterium]
MKNKSLFILILVLFIALPFFKVGAQDICSKNGYTVLAINGIFTDEKEAVENKDKLKDRFYLPYHNEPVKVDYIYNSTHLGGVGDLFDSIRQGLFDQKSDYDLVEMLNDASEKVGTQKLLIVGHSQGNFYANSFYDKVADKEGGVPRESLGVYSVATPADHVAGNGKYLTSDTDSIIANVVGRVKNIMTPNTHIVLEKADGNGHSFSDVYLKYRSKEIVADIKSSFDKLKTNSIQGEAELCISPQKITAFHKVSGALLATADFTVNNTVKATSFAYNTINNTARSLAGTFVNLAKRSLAMVGLVDNIENAPSIAESALGDSTEPEGPITTIDQSQEEIKTENTDDQTPSTDTQDNNLETDPIVVPAPTPPVLSGGHGSGGGGNTPTPEVPVLDTVAPVLDTTPPIITLVGESVITINLNTDYIDVGATAVDDIDTTVAVTTAGTVDIATIGSYILTYNATDIAGNIATPVTRTVNVVEAPITIDTTAPVISLIGENFLAIKINSEYIESGATALDDKDGVINVITTGTVDTKTVGDYTITYTATDIAGNTSTMTRIVRVSNYIYISKYTFGTGNGDGNDWQVWIFNGSSAYDWTDTYVNKYLHEKFKLKADTGGYWCSDCLERGIFTHDPRKGFEPSDVTISTLEGNPQNSYSGITYDVSMQWDSTGYTTIISHGDIVDSTTRVNVPNMNNDLWVGWDGMQNRFRQFPSLGGWQGLLTTSPNGLAGGTGMVMVPYPVYNPDAIDETPAPAEQPILSQEKLITSFNFDSLDPKVTGVVDNTNHTIQLTVPYGTDVKTLVPTIEVSTKASVSPVSLSSQDFTAPVTYIVKAEDDSTLSYIATVTISPDPNPTPLPVSDDDILPTITSYTLNGNQASTTLNPIEDNLSIILNANKNVNWMSIKIEKEDSDSIYKTLQSNTTTCIDGTKICTKVWEGDLSKGGLLQNGNYKIKVHMQDAIKNDYEKYLDSIITVIGQ